MQQKNIFSYFILLIIVCMLIFIFHRFISQKTPFVYYSESDNSTYFKIQDYAYHIIITKNFWFYNYGNIYDVKFQIESLTKHIGKKTTYPMAIGITPIALIIWFPFAWVSIYSLSLSYTLWVSFSLLTLYSGFLLIAIDFYENKKPPFILILLIFVTLFSTSHFLGLALGQTSIFSSGLIIHLMRIINKSDKKGKVDTFFLFLILFASGIKPVYSIIAFGILLIYKKWREAFTSTLTMFLILALITPFLTFDWISSYLNLLKMYSSGEFPIFYEWAVVPNTKTIFRSAFKDIIGDKIANSISNYVTLFTYLFVIGCSITKTNTNQFKLLNIFQKTTKEQAIAILIGSYLLFAPFANPCEDFLFLILLITSVITKKFPKLTFSGGIIFAFLVFLIMSQSFLYYRNFLWLLWLIKATIIFLMIYFFRFEYSNNFMTRS